MRLWPTSSPFLLLLCSESEPFYPTTKEHMKQWFATGPWQWYQVVMDGNLLNCEHKHLFSISKWMSWLFYYSYKKLTSNLFAICLHAWFQKASSWWSRMLIFVLNGYHGVSYRVCARSMHSVSNWILLTLEHQWISHYMQASGGILYSFQWAGQFY